MPVTEVEQRGEGNVGLNHHHRKFWHHNAHTFKNTFFWILLNGKKINGKKMQEKCGSVSEWIDFVPSFHIISFQNERTNQANFPSGRPVKSFLMDMIFIIALVDGIIIFNDDFLFFSDLYCLFLLSHAHVSPLYTLFWSIQAVKVYKVIVKWSTKS